MNYKLSVVIPTYKRTKSLSRLLNLLKQQTIADEIQVIIIDQNKPGFLLSEIGESVLADVQHIFQDEPNVSLARNCGVKHALANYILFLDDDIIPDTDFCEKGMSILNENTHIKILSPTLLRKSQTAKEVLPKKVTENIYPLSSKDKYLHATFFTISACTFYDKTEYFKTGGFDPYLFRFAKTNEDQEFFIRLMKNNFKVYLSANLQVVIDEDMAGGCELRTAEYWISRRKNVRAMAYRLRIHNNIPGIFSLINLIQILRSFVINKKVLKSGVKNIIKEFKLMLSSIKESKVYFLNHYKNYITAVDFLKEYKVDKI
jgi:GT2 family glycosyltransferase